MSELVITPPAAGDAQLILADGDETLDLLGDLSGRGIWLADEPKFPLPAREDTYAEGADSEGRRRVRTRPTNGTGSIPLTIGADDASQFWGYVDQLQEMVESAHQRRGTLTYTPPGGTQVTYRIESISVTGLPQKGVQLLQYVQDGIVIEFECQPYGLLEVVDLTPQGDAYSEIVIADEPSLYWRLGSAGLTDQSGNGNNGTAQGGLTVGGVAGAIASDVDAATEFDGSSDYAESTYTGCFNNAIVTTFEGWAWRDTTADYHHLFADSGSTSNALRVDTGSSDVTFSIAFVGTNTWTAAWPGTAQWVHWVLIVDPAGDEVELYINGVSQGADAFVSLAWSAATGFQIGARATTPPELFWDGKMDEVAVYERALAPDEIAEHYDTGVNGPATAFQLDGPIDSFEATDVPGHVPALGELTLTDVSTQSRDYIEVGLEQEGYDPDAPTPLLIDSDDCDVSGFAGAIASDSDAYDPAGATTNNVVQATCTTTAVTVCSTDAQEHIGRKRIYSRVKASATGTYVRLAWKVGDGPISRGPWRAIPAASNFYDLYLDTITIEEVPEGTHEWTGYIEAYAASGGDTVKVDFVTVFPAEVWGRARAPFTAPVPTAFSARSGFNTESGSIAGDTLDDGANVWVEAGDAVRFSAAAGVATRTEVSDTANTGAWATVDLNLTDTAVQAEISHDDATASEGAAMKAGVVARFADANNHVRAVMRRAPGGGVNRAQLRVEKRVGGTITALMDWTAALGTAQIISPATLILVVYASGVWRAEVNGSLVGSGFDSALATGGTLAPGDVGLYDEYTAASALTRTYDNFAAWVPPVDHVMYGDESAAFTHETALRENSAGTRWGRVPAFDGKHLRIPPATRAGRVSRVAVRTRRLDGPDGLPDTGLADDLEATLTVTPRVLLV